VRCSIAEVAERLTNNLWVVGSNLDCVVKFFHCVFFLEYFLSFISILTVYYIRVMDNVLLLMVCVRCNSSREINTEIVSHDQIVRVERSEKLWKR